MISIHKKQYENTTEIQSYNHDKEEWVSLQETLTDLKFTKEQTEFLNDMFHKLVNRKIEVI